MCIGNYLSLCVVAEISKKLTNNILIGESFNQFIILYYHFWFTEENNFFGGAVKRNGLKNVKLPNDKVLMQKPRDTGHKIQLH